MRAIRLSFCHMLKLIRHDRMLSVAGLTPLLAGGAIHFGVPLIEKELIRFTGWSVVLSPYYGLFDTFFASISPAMFCFIAAMVMLEEHDDHIDRYLFITGLGRNGYLISRIVIPALVSFVVTVVLLPLFELTALSGMEIFFLSLTGSLQGIIIALPIITLSSNKLEGMAVTKLSALIILGAVLPYFVPAPLYFFLSFLPSFWMGMAMQNDAFGYMIPAVLISGIWILILRVKF